MKNNSHQDTIKGKASLARKRRHLTVSASPFNGVKLDLAIIIVLAVILLVVLPRLVDNYATQIIYLGGFGILSMIWLIVRSRRILHSFQSSNQGEDDQET